MCRAFGHCGLPPDSVKRVCKTFPSSYDDFSFILTGVQDCVDMSRFEQSLMQANIHELMSYKYSLKLIVLCALFSLAYSHNCVVQIIAHQCENPWQSVILQDAIESCRSYPNNPEDIAIDLYK